MAFAFAIEPLGQVGRPATASKPVPRAANGKPDLSGIWIANGALRLMAGDEEVKRIQQADAAAGRKPLPPRSEEHTSELQSRLHLVCRLLLEKKNKQGEEIV